MHIDELRIPRKKFLVTGLALGAAAVAAACTTYGKKPAASSAPAPAPNASGGAPAPAPNASGGAPASGAPANVLAKTSDVPVGSGVIVGDVVITQPSSGQFRGFSTTCTHAGCAVAEVKSGTINCPCHGSEFNLEGSVARGPASRPLEAKAVTVQGDSIVLG
jgi:Rieske Fe-S protein